MKEVWVKKTIWRRYLVHDVNVDVVAEILQKDANGDEIVADAYDVNTKVEYDNEKVVLPVEVLIQGV